MYPGPKYTALGLTAVGLAVLGALFILFPAVRMLGVALLITAIIIGIVVLTQRDRIIWEGVTAICLPAVILVAAAGIGIASTPSTSTPSAHRTVSNSSPAETTSTPSSTPTTSSPTPTPSALSKEEIKAWFDTAGQACGTAEKPSWFSEPDKQYFAFASIKATDKDDPRYVSRVEAKCVISSLGVPEDSAYLMVQDAYTNLKRHRTTTDGLTIVIDEHPSVPNMVVVLVGPRDAS